MYEEDYEEEEFNEWENYFVYGPCNQYEDSFETLEEAVEYIDQYSTKADDEYGGWRIEDRDGKEITDWTPKRNAYDLAYDSIRIIEQATKKDDLGNLTSQQLQDIITKVYDILSEIRGM